MALALTILAAAALALAAPPAKTTAPVKKTEVPRELLAKTNGPAQAAEMIARGPVYFEPNVGQSDEEVKFIARGVGQQIFLMGNEAVMVMHRRMPGKDGRYTRAFAEYSARPIRMKMEGAQAPEKAEGIGRLASYSNYFLGPDPAKWRSRVPHYEKASFTNVYAGIDLVYYATQKQLEFDFIVKPGADPDSIRLSYQNVDKTKVDENGDLILMAGEYTIRQQKPHIYQEVDGRRRKIEGSYMLLADGKVGFRLRNYDKERAVVIDPILTFATFLGGNGQEAGGSIQIDNQQNAFIAGQTASTNFPTRTPFQGNLASAGNFDGFVTKMNTSNAALIYSTYIGGSNYENLISLTMDTSGDVFVGGVTGSTGFPTTPNTESVRNFQGGTYDGMLFKLSSDGTQLRYSTFVGTNTNDVINSLALAGGRVQLGGTMGANLQQSVGISPVNQAAGPVAAYLGQYSMTSARCQAFTYYGGNAVETPDQVQQIATDSNGNIYAAGTTFTSGLQRNSGTTFGGAKDGFVMKWTSSLGVQYFHYIGGSLEDEAQAIAVSPNGDVFVTGYMRSTNTFVNTTLGSLANGQPDAFLVRVNQNIIRNWAIIGGSQADSGWGVAVDAFGTAYVGGQTRSSDFPTTFGAPQKTPGGGYDVVVFRLQSNSKLSNVSGYFGFNLLFSSYFGYSPDEQAWAITIDGGGKIYFTGVLSAPTTNSGSVFPDGQTVLPFGGGILDSFVAKLAAAQLQVTGKGYWVLDTAGFYTYVADVTLANANGDAISNMAAGYRNTPTGTSFSCTGCSSALAISRTNVAAGATSAKAQFRLKYTSSPGSFSADKAAGAHERAAFNLPPGTPPSPPEVGTTTDSPLVPPEIPTPGRPSSCTPSFASSTLSVPAAGGNFNVDVQGLTDACGWFVSGTSGTFFTVNNADIQPEDTGLNITVQPNGGGLRTGSVTVRGFDDVTLNISQAGQCTVGVTPTNVSNFSSNGGLQTFTVTASAGCAWSATGFPSWMVPTTATSGTGNGAVTFNIQANGPSTRSSAFSIGGVDISVSQLGTGGVTPGLKFVPLTPCRVMETREEYNFEGRTGSFGPPFLSANSTRTLNLPVSNVCSIPSSAKAYVVNVTVIPSAGVNFVTVWPAGETRPNVWTIRSPDGQIVANSAIVKAGTNGGISVFTSDNTDLLIDISGYYTDSNPVNGLAFYPLTPCRVIETRALYRPETGQFGPPSMNAQQTRSFQFPASPHCSVPNAVAYSVTITVVPPAALAFLTAWPNGSSRPNVSSINSFAGRVLANSVIIPASSNGTIDVFTFNATDFIIDINGYYAPDDGVNGQFYFPVTQCRANDSTVSGGQYPDESTRTINIPASPGCTGIPTNARGYAINVTALPGGNPMPFLTAYPTGQTQPNASILNAFQGQIVSNAAIVPAGTGGSINIFAFRRTDVVVEVSGYFGR
ncbi:MAG: hypothetical protein HY820_45825 [Acidobacteria bacterium]|nr:hypothetical protein [Acidobacteriota bacterium]